MLTSQGTYCVLRCEPVSLQPLLHVVWGTEELTEIIRGMNPDSGHLISLGSVGRGEQMENSFLASLCWPLERERWAF